jgi:hypothetical protein
MEKDVGCDQGRKSAEHVLVSKEPSILIHNNRDTVTKPRQQHYYRRNQHNPGSVVLKLKEPQAIHAAEKVKCHSSHYGNGQ